MSGPAEGPEALSVGDDGKVLPGLRAAANVSGAKAFTAAGGTDVFAALDQLQSDLLLLAPIAVSVGSRQGAQVILHDAGYGTRERLPP